MDRTVKITDWDLKKELFVKFSSLLEWIARNKCPSKCIGASGDIWLYLLVSINIVIKITTAVSFNTCAFHVYCNNRHMEAIFIATFRVCSKQHSVRGIKYFLKISYNQEGKEER